MYIVTERLATDMLELILSQNQNRLAERITKFISYQVSTNQDLFKTFIQKLTSF